jgi:putative glutathione S-transferase
MGMLVDGVWKDVWYDTKSTGGHFKRSESAFRNWVTADGSPGPSGDGGFAAEAGRYHLYVSLACPWAHRTLIFRKLKGLEDAISLSIVDPHMGENGWEFRDRDGGTKDHIGDADYLWQVYVAAKPDYSGRVTVPVLWDKKTGTVVSNESAEIIRMFNSAFNAIASLRPTTIPRRCARKSTTSTRSSITRSTTAFTRRALPPPRTPTKSTLQNSSMRSTCWMNASGTTAT